MEGILCRLNNWICQGRADGGGELLHLREDENVDGYLMRVKDGTVYIGLDEGGRLYEFVHKDWRLGWYSVVGSAREYVNHLHGETCKEDRTETIKWFLRVP